MAMGPFAAKASFEAARSHHLAAGLADGRSDSQIKAHLLMSAEADLKR